MENFVKLFESNGFSVESFGDMSYIADNGTFCVPFTVHSMQTKYGPHSDISAVSFLSEDKELIKEYYRKRDKQYIGCEVFSDWMNNILKFTPIGGICNHDYSFFEIENWLARINNHK